MDRVNNIPLPAFMEPYYAKGILDTSFGENGIVQNNIIMNSIEDSVGCSIVTDRYGRIYVVGLVVKNEVSDLAFWRFNSDGKPNPIFETNGYIATINWGNDVNDYGQIFSPVMTIDNNGIIYIACSCPMMTNFGGAYNLVIFRYNTNIKQSDNLNLFVRFDPSEYGAVPYQFPHGIKIDNKGRLVVIGQQNNNIIMWRYNNGSLDQTFGENGYVIGPNFIGNISFGIINKIGFTIDNKCRILMTGPIFSESASSSIDVISIYRFNEDGTLDSDFGENGLVILDGAARNNDTGGGDFGADVACDSQGRIFVLGASVNYMDKSKMVLLCYNEDGLLNNDFGNSGVVVNGDIHNEPYYGETGLRIMFDSVGKIIVGGLYSAGMAIWRYNNDGTPDLGFGNNGYTCYDYDIMNDKNYMYSLTMDSYGRILVLGGMGYENYQMTLWRFK
ncbi:MAG: hypothetical protein JXA07_02155 [Spirochaetes bacterium]|nr:hypothetical protein [Spirochaetota bacterium]